VANLDLKFGLRYVSEEEVRRALDKLKNKSSSGIDGVSAKILKSSADVLQVPLTRIVNASIEQGYFPSAWKIAKVVPLYKKGDRKDKANYRPVSLLPVASKVLESVVGKQLSRYFESRGLFPKGQHGFRANRSTESALLSMHDDWVAARNLQNYQINFF